MLASAHRSHCLATLLAVWVCLGVWSVSDPVMAAQSNRLYLPVISRALEITPSWAYVMTCGTPLSAPHPSPAVLPPGVRLLESRFLIGGGVGLPWRAEWHLNGQAVPGLTETGTIPVSGLISMQVAANADTCKDLLPAGQYVVRLYLADTLRAVATATLP